MKTVEQIKTAQYVVTMDDGSTWHVPVMAIARNRADNYKDEFDNDIERSLNEDTLPLFAESEYEIYDWAQNNMNWSDVADQAVKVGETPKPKIDWEECWVNGEKEIVYS